MSIAIAGCGFSAGCGGDESAATGEASVEWGAYCEGRAALECKGFDTAVCKEQESCARALIRDEVETQLLDCLLGTCGWESCLKKISELPLSKAGEAFRDACVQRTGRCGKNDDVCFAGDLLPDDGVGELDACLDIAVCDPMKACMDKYFETKYQPCTSWQ